MPHGRPVTILTLPQSVTNTQNLPPSLVPLFQCRIVGLSASLANAKDVGDWIGATAHSLVSFRPDVRPVPLELKLHGFDVNHFGSRMLAMAKPAYNYVAGGCAGGCCAVR